MTAANRRQESADHRGVTLRSPRAPGAIPTASAVVLSGAKPRGLGSNEVVRPAHHSAKINLMAQNAEDPKRGPLRPGRQIAKWCRSSAGRRRRVDEGECGDLNVRLPTGLQTGVRSQCHRGGAAPGRVARALHLDEEHRRVVRCMEAAKPARRSRCVGKETLAGCSTSSETRVGRAGRGAVRRALVIHRAAPPPTSIDETRCSRTASRLDPRALPQGRQTPIRRRRRRQDGDIQERIKHARIQPAASRSSPASASTREGTNSCARGWIEGLFFGDDFCSTGTTRISTSRRSTAPRSRRASGLIYGSYQPPARACASPRGPHGGRVLRDTEGQDVLLVSTTLPLQQAARGSALPAACRAGGLPAQPGDRDGELQEEHSHRKRRARSPGAGDIVPPTT